MSEIKTACRGTSRLIEAATMTHEEYLNLHTQGAKELRAAYESLQKENEAQAKRIAELEEHVTKLGSGSRQHLYKAFARRYKEILSLRKENEALHKQVDEHNEWHMMRDEMRKALEAQMNGDSK